MFLKKNRKNIFRENVLKKKYFEFFYKKFQFEKYNSKTINFFKKLFNEKIKYNYSLKR